MNGYANDVAPVVKKCEQNINSHFSENTNFSPPGLYGDSHSPYEQQWIDLFETIPSKLNTDINVHMKRLQNAAITETLRFSPFRTLSWRIFLEILPRNIKYWRSSLSFERRRFADLVAKLNNDPRDPDNKQDHPLNRDSSSRWNQYFIAERVRRNIACDVDRTFPNECYFREPAVQSMMIDLLELYTDRSAVQYKQGMHELLAPICYQFRNEYIAFKCACDMNQLSATSEHYLSIIYDPDYFEADVYAVFERVMYVVREWYICDELNQSNPNGEILALTANQTPGTMYINDIDQTLLRHFDQKLYLHLKHLEIDSALFGLRWIRLLFGHEFQLNDLLYVWDCVFAIGQEFTLVRFIYVALLILMSKELLTREMSECLSVLMQSPTPFQAETVVKKALNLYNPKLYPMETDQEEIENIKPKMNEKQSRPKLQERSLMRRRTMHEFNRNSPVTIRTRSSTSLNISNLGRDFVQGFLVALSGRNTPTVPLSPSTFRRAIGKTALTQEKFEQLYRKCFQAIDLCSSHLDVVISRIKEPADEKYPSGTNINQTMNEFSYQEHLTRAKFEICRVKDLLDELISAGGYPTASPMLQRYGCDQRAGSVVDRENSSPISRIFSKKPRNQIHQSYITKYEDSEDDEEADDIPEAVRVFPPGSVIQMANLNGQRGLNTFSGDLEADEP